MLNISAGSYLGGSTSGSASAYTRNATSANIRSMSRDIQAGYSQDIEMIQKYLQQGKTDKAIELYEDLMNDVEASSSNYRYSINESQIQSAIKTAYESTTGSSLVNEIEDNTASSFWTGFKQSIPIFGLFCNDTSDAEALAKMTGTEVSTKDKVLEFAGLAVGTVAFWALGGWITKGLGAITGGIQAGSNAAKVASALEKAKILKTTTNAAGAASAAGTTINYAMTNGAKFALGAAAASSAATTGINVIDEATDSI